MKTEKEIYFDFYGCEIHTSSSTAKKLDADAVLNSILRIRKDPTKNTVRSVAGQSYEIRFLEKTSYGYKGIIGKYKYADLPVAAVPGGEEREIELEKNEHLLEKCYFCYFSDYSLLIIQRNRFAISPEHFASYLSPSGYTFCLNPVIEPADLKKLLNNDVNIRALNLTIARPTNPDLFKDSTHDFTNSVVKSLNNSNAASLNIILRGDGHSSTPDQRYLDPKIKRALLEMKGKFHLNRAKLSLEENGITHPLDLVTDRLSHNVTVQLSGRYPLAADMWKAIMDSRKTKEAELTAYFGSLNSAKLI